MGVVCAGRHSTAVGCGHLDSAGLLHFGALRQWLDGGRAQGPPGRLETAKKITARPLKGALSMLTRDDMAALCADLMAADDAADAQKLAAIAWRLYGEAGIDEAEIDRLHAVLRSRSGGR